MAYDKVVDSAKLDGAMKATADGIRETTNYEGELPWDEELGFYNPIIGLVSNAVESARSEGYADGYSSGNDAGYNQGYTKGYDEGYDEGVPIGKKEEHDRFWDVYATQSTTGWTYAFSGARWVDEIYNPPAPLVATSPTSTSSFNGTFYFSSITDTKVDIVSYIASMRDTFYGSKLVTIRSLEVSENVQFANCFYNCSNLQNLTMKGTIGQNGFNVRWSTNLSHDSIVSVINALSTNTSGLTVTLSKSAVNKAFETSDGANDGSTSTEWLTLIGTRSNWTISLL